MIVPDPGRVPEIEPDPEFAMEFDDLTAVQRSEYRVYGVAVQHYRPRRWTGGPPVVLLHGGNGAHWVWDRHAAFLAGRGHDVHVPDWYGHGDSVGLDPAEYLNRGIGDVAGAELALVVDSLGRDPVLVGHSMGALASAMYGAERPVDRLVLMASVPPAQARPDPVPVPIDFTRPFPVPPFDQVRQMFFTTMGHDEARRWYELLEPESPKAVFEASRGAAWLEYERIEAPVLLIAAERDALYPPPVQDRFAELLGAELVVIPDVGHADLLLQDRVWRASARALDRWLPRPTP